MLMPLMPLMSVSTLVSCRFISIKAFCIRWIALLASANRLPLCRCRHSARAIRISSVG
jgi:hypothetical protein